MPRLVVCSVTRYHECSYDRSQYATIARTIGRRMLRSIDRTIGRRPSRLIVHRSLIATTSRTTSSDGYCHRYSPIVRDSATTRRDRSRYATAAGDRSKNCRSDSPWTNRNQSYDPENVRSGVTVTLFLLSVSSLLFSPFEGFGLRDHHRSSVNWLKCIHSAYNIMHISFLQNVCARQDHLRNRVQSQIPV